MEGKRLNGDLVRMLRQSLRLKQVEFAARIGISQMMVSYIENGQRRISETTEGRTRREFNISDLSVGYLNAAHQAAINSQEGNYVSSDIINMEPMMKTSPSDSFRPAVIMLPIIDNVRLSIL